MATGEHLTRPDQQAPLDRLVELAGSLLRAATAQLLLVGEIARPGASGSLGDLCAQVADGDQPVLTAGVLAVPLRDTSGTVVAALAVSDGPGRVWTAADVTLLEQIAVFAANELHVVASTAEYEKSHARLEMAVEAAQIGTFEWDLVTGKFSCNERLATLFGYEKNAYEPSLQGFFLGRLHPEDLDGVNAAIEHAIVAVGVYEAEYRVLLPTGQIRWLVAKGQVFADSAGAARRLLGATYDTTDVHEGKAKVEQVLEAMPAGFCLLDPEWRFTYVNPEAERILGHSRELLLGRKHWDVFPASGGSEFELNYRRAVDTGKPVVFEGYSPTVDSWFELRAWPSAEGLSIYFLDISARRAAQKVAELTLARWALLAEVAAELSGTLDGMESVGRLAQLVVPALGDWCIVTVAEDDGYGGGRRVVRDVGWWHSEAYLRPQVDRYCALRVGSLSQESLVERVLRTGRSVVVGRDASTVMRSVLVPGEADDLAAALAPDSFALFPLRGRDHTVGVLTLFNSKGRAPLSAQELVTAAEVADRAGMALDNARLFAEQRDLAEALQRSLLTDPPVTAGVEVAVRYAPAAQAAQVGGDWYDAFCQPDGATMFVIGDVVGHDTAAAAAMGQLRALLRGIAACNGDGPSDVLISVDQVIATLQIDTTATVIVARLEQTPNEKTRGVSRLRWSNAGHPPPMVVDKSGAVDALTAVEADLLLGFDPRATRVEWTTVLRSGSTVLLYTDGLVERRGQSLDDGIALLQSTLTEFAHLELDVLCDAVLTRLLPAQPEDDVALVAVRLG